jgi:hypothetical protein
VVHEHLINVRRAARFRCRLEQNSIHSSGVPKSAALESATRDMTVASGDGCGRRGDFFLALIERRLGKRADGQPDMSDGGRIGTSEESGRVVEAD